MTKPLFVAISDIHFNINNLPLASSALEAAINMANEFNLPLIIAGDLNDTKAIIRAEVANSLISLLKLAKTPVYILVGNHDLLNEKVSQHGLNYLKPYAKIIDEVTTLEIDSYKVTLIPYQNSSEKLQNALQSIPKGSLLIMHQGFQGAFMGDYIQDKTSISPEAVADYKVISGHYHKHQTVGSVTYIGSPYTITFGEANDGAKGFLLVNGDGSFTQEILQLRKHIILETTIVDLNSLTSHAGPKDLVWLKVSGPYSELKKLKKDEIGQNLLGHCNFKLDLIVTENDEEKQAPTKVLTPNEVFDTLIDGLTDPDDQKIYLKQLWRDILQ